MLDLSAAFDTIDHQTILTRLHREFGFRDKILKWISSYLSVCRHHVKVSGVLSPVYSLDWGVPQRSILGTSIFFTICSTLGEDNLGASSKHNVLCG